MDHFTVLPFLLAMIIAVAAMPTDVVRVCYGEMGFEYTQPWRSTARAFFAARARTWLSRLRTALSHPLAIPVTCLVVALLVSTALPAVGATVSIAAVPNIKHIKQDIADNAAAQAKFKKDANELLAIGSTKWTDEQKVRFAAVEKDYDACVAKAADLEAEHARALKFQDEERRTGDPAIALGADLAAAKPWANFGEQLQAIHAFKTRGVADPRLFAAAQGAGEAVDSDGGFLVGQDTAAAIEKRMFDSSQILGRCREITIGAASNGLDLKTVDETSRATGSRWGGVQGYWVDEGTEPTASKPKFGKIALKLKKVAAFGYASDELLSDAVAMGSIYEQAFAEELTFLVEDAIFNGTGAGQPQGILNASCLVSITKETNQAATSIVYANIVKMWSRMWSRARANAVWFINQDIEPQLFQMALSVGTGGVPVYLPANGLSASPFGTLMGRSVVPIEYCATLGTVGDIIVADLSQYGLITKGGVNQASSMHVAFKTDEQAFRATYRIDGQALWRAALTPFKGTSNTLSPFVALATRA